ncbi:hypothetical protein [Spirosoma foliorum]|uniref:Uncharacterized protein n=1 Tax=Spirosoma foliorum TaxID=2710596 RepID=A0A7G5GRH9_9BACT|nr:hypothetical protein [Spirosoma foliorum]QMW01471.1 hypothetical protein H3H32_26440 [Spirosoma foliorum]
MNTNLNRPTPLSPLTKVIQIADQIEQLQPGQPATSLFNAFKSAVWQLIQVAANAYSYRLAWAMVTLHARSALRSYENGHSDALRQLKRLIKQSVTLLP